MIYCNVFVVLFFVIKLYYFRLMEIIDIEDCLGMGFVLLEDNIEDNEEEEEEIDFGGGLLVL